MTLVRKFRHFATEAAMTETIAIVALVVAVVAILIACRLGVRVEALESLLEADGEEEAEEEAQELWLSEGEFYAPDKAALEAKFPDAMGFVMCEGVPSAVTATGVWSLHKLLTDKPRVQSIK